MRSGRKITIMRGVRNMNRPKDMPSDDVNHERRVLFLDTGGIDVVVEVVTSSPFLLLLLLRVSRFIAEVISSRPTTMSE